MPRFFSHFFINGEMVRDLEGVCLPTFEDAKLDAQLSVRSLLAERVKAGDDAADFEVQVVAENGAEVTTVYGRIAVTWLQPTSPATASDLALAEAKLYGAP